MTQVILIDRYGACTVIEADTDTDIIPVAAFAEPVSCAWQGQRAVRLRAAMYQRTREMIDGRPVFVELEAAA